MIGVLNANSSVLNAFSEADERLLLTLAGQIASAIENFRLFKNVQRQLFELSEIHTIALSFGAFTDLKESLTSLTGQVAKAVRAETCFVIDMDEGSYHVRTPGYGLSEDALKQYEKAMVGWDEWTANLGNTIFCNDSPNLDSPFDVLSANLGVRSVLWVPMKFEGRTTGSGYWEGRCCYAR